MENELNKNEVLSLTINNNTDNYLLINKKHLQVASILNILDLKGMNNPDNFPMLSLPFLDWINTYDFSKYKLIEFGSGSSTNYFADRFLSVLSFETNEEWFNKISKNIKTNVDYRFISKKDAIHANYNIDIDNNTFVLIDIDLDRTSFIKSFLIKHNPNILIIDNAEWYPDTCQRIQDIGYSEIPFWGIRFEDYCDKKTSVFIKHGFNLPKTKYKHYTEGSFVFSKEN